jgi:type IV pilus biogenesis protein CpaD/CtpE
MGLAFCCFSNLDERRKAMRKSSSLVLSLMLIAGLAGCSTQRTTTQEVAYDRHTGEPITVERQTTTTTDETQDTGVVSGTVNVIGEVISLPFRAVGGLVRAIF